MRRSRWNHAVLLVVLLAAALFLFTHRGVAIQDSEGDVWFGPAGSLRDIALS